MNRDQQLSDLTSSLEQLSRWLKLDPDCQWLKHFKMCLNTATGYLEEGYTQDDLNSLSSSIRSVYGGMGSFNDYCPPPMDLARAAWYKQYGNPDEIIGDVYDGALDLMVVGIKKE